MTACPGQTGTGHLREIKNIIMVASGKGGVGKSTTAVNLALALHAEGAKVGLLDTDIYGPSQRTMLGVADDVKPELVDEKFLKPVIRMGIKSMSVGYLSEEKAPMIWRGPMATRMLSQLLEQTIWGELDYLDDGTISAALKARLRSHRRGLARQSWQWIVQSNRVSQRPILRRPKGQIGARGQRRAADHAEDPGLGSQIAAPPRPLAAT